MIGFPERADDVYNAAAVCAGGEIVGVYRKLRLPNYGVFDELRYFQSGTEPMLVEIDGVQVGLTICEDVWMPGEPLASEALAGARLVVNLSASPFNAGKAMQRERMLAQRARDSLCAVAFCALVGGQDELVFDGSSVVLDHRGEAIARAPQMAEHLLLCDVDTAAPGAARLKDSRPRAAIRAERPTVARLPAITTGATIQAPSAEHRVGGELFAPLPELDEVYAALVLGTRDYVEKNGFAKVTLGVSGGVDSALVLLVAVDALGPERVVAVTMPSRYSSTGTQADARLLAENLGCELLTLPIAGPMAAFDEVLDPAFAGREPDLTEENLQARIRGNLLMALSNKFGWLVLTCGNKSEMSVGYSTLYGDSAGGFAVIKDVPKTLVYRLVAHRAGRDPQDPVPADIATRRSDAPSSGRSSATTTRFPPTRSSTPSSRATSRTTSVATRSSRAGCPRPTSTGSSVWSTWPSTSAARCRRGSRSPLGRSGATAGCRSSTAPAGRDAARPGPSPAAACVQSLWRTSLTLSAASPTLSLTLPVA